MGVIHKLREEVVSFIISQKKDSPSVGVRQLSALTSEKFQIKVSKSSVNTILKNASLSSCVGRRTVGTPKDKKFSIPPIRKKEITENLQKLGFVSDEALLILKEVDDCKITPQRMPTSTPIEKSNATEVKDVDIKAGQDFLNHVKLIRDQINEQRGKIFKGMGYIFLKAGQWEVSSKSTMAELFKKYVTEGPLPAVFDAASEMFLFLKYLGAENINQVSTYKEHGLWQLNIFGPSLDEEKILQKVGELFERVETLDESAATNAAMEYNLKKEQVFSRVSCFRLLLEDETQLNVDASFSILGGNALSAALDCQGLPINKAMTWLSKFLISNNSNITFRAIAGDAQFDKTFFDMVAVFENFPGKKIVKISVLDKEGETLAEFSTIPKRRRIFLTGVNPKQKEFVQLTENVKWANKRPYYHQETNRIIYFSETKSGYFKERFQQKLSDYRVITIWNEEEKNPFWAILTNREEGSGEEILRSYMSRWPYFDEYRKGEALNREQGKSECVMQGGEFTQFSGIFLDFIERLNCYCQQRFFSQKFSEINISSMMQTIYETPGSIEEEEGRITAVLNVPETSLHRKDMERAAGCVNECHIFDHYGRKLWIKILPTV